ncbi:hypothetical protein ACHAWX_003227 [Stephanocyclus meneghinianus]
MARLAERVLTLSLVLGLALAAALSAYATPLLRLMGINVMGPTAKGHTEQFLMVQALAALAVLVCLAYIRILRGYLDVATPTVFLGGSNIVNLALDVVLVAWQVWGPLWVGIATTVAECIAAVVFLGVLAGIFPSILSEQRMDIMPSWELLRWEEIRPLIMALSSVFL